MFSLLFAPGLPLQAAPPPVELQLGGAGSMPWNITNVKPGDSGTQMLTVRNDGSASGLLYLWISDIVDTLAPVRPGVPVDPDESWKLSDHLLLEPVSGLRSATIPLPAIVAEYPQSVDIANKVTISPIAPGQTVDLTWEWYLPITVGNAIQANSLTFTMNYTLEEMPVTPIPGDGGGPVPTTTTITTSPTATTPGPDEIFTFIITTPEKQESMEVKGDGTISESRTINAVSENFTISFDRDTRIVTADNSITTELKISHPTFIPDPPPGHVILGPVYELLFYTNDGPRPVRLTQPARVILDYAMLIIPEYVQTLFIASWDEENGWTQLQQVTGLVVGEGQLGALIDHFTIFTILGRIEDDEEPPVIKPPLPARFDVDRLSLSVEQVQSGDPATIRVNVVNTGELQGEILLTLKVNGLFVESQLVRLEPGQNRNVSFVLSTFKPGEYEVEVNGLRQVLVVTEGPASEFEDTIARYWPMPAIPVLAGIAVVLAGVAWLIVARKHA